MIKYVLNEVLKEEDIVSFMTHYKKVIPDNVSFMDGIVFIFVLAMIQGRSFDIHDVERHDIRYCYDGAEGTYEYYIHGIFLGGFFKVDDMGRMIELSYKNCIGPLHFPLIIRCLDRFLDRLKYFTVS